MPTNEERREVADRLRKTKRECASRGYPWMVDDLILALGYRHDYEAEDSIFDHLADLIDLLTCRNVSGYQDVFECSECGCRAELVTELRDKHGEPFHVPLMPSFCPGCGAEVVTGDGEEG